jgi:Ribbon-helix-helix protein, copG family
MLARYDVVKMSKVRTTLTIDESVMKAVKIRAARTGRGDSQVIEESLRRDMRLDLLERLWDKRDLPERDAEALAVEAQHKTRTRRR